MNLAAFRFVNQTIRNPLLDAVLPFFSDKDFFIIPGFVAALLLLHFGRRHARTCVVGLVLGLLLADLGCEKGLKNFFRQERPYAVVESVNIYRGGAWSVYDPAWYGADPRQSHSFPSTHAANVAAVAVALAFLNRRTLWATLPLALLVGVSRVYTGNHYPGDVLAGYAWGAAVAHATTMLSFGLARRIWGPAAPEKSREPMPEGRAAFLCLLGLWTAVNFFYVYTSDLSLAGDEAQYWDWSRRLDWAYYSKPPLIAYIMALLTGVAGHKEWALRSGAVLFSSGTLALIYATALRISKREQTAFLAVLAALAMPATWAGSVLMTVDPPTVFFWALGLFAFHRAVNGEPACWWLTGLALGLGMLAKYVALLQLASFALYLLLVDRRPLRTFGPYGAVLLMALCLSGVLYWNAVNDWVSVRHMSSIGAEEEHAARHALSQFFEFLGGQMGAVSPILFGFFAWAVLRMARRFRTDRDAALVFLSVAVLFFFYAVVSLARRSLVNWPVASYVAAAVALAWVWAERPRGPRARRWLAAALALGCAIGLVARSSDLLYAASARYIGTGGSADRIRLPGLSINPDRDPTNHMAGGREIGTALSRILAAEPDPDRLFLFSNRYQLTAWAAFYTEGRPPTYCMDVDDNRRLNQYDLWGGWEDLVGKDALFITGDDELKATWFIARMLDAGAFESGECIETVKVYRGRTLVRQFTISRLRGYTGALRGPSGGKY